MEGTDDKSPLAIDKCQQIVDGRSALFFSDYYQSFIYSTIHCMWQVLSKHSDYGQVHKLERIWREAVLLRIAIFTDGYMTLVKLSLTVE